MSTLRDHLQRIYDERGTLTPALVVDEARDPEHPLHSRFEWDDTTAAEKYRLTQGADLIRSVKIRRREEDKQSDLRAFVSVRPEGPTTGTYVPTEQAMADPFQRQLVLRAMDREWKAFKRRYQHMAEFAELIKSETEGLAS